MPRARQKYPKTKVKLGAKFYKVFSWTDNDGKSHSEVQEWVVRAIRKKYDFMKDENLPTVYFTHKIKGLTWVKSKTRGGGTKWGWAKRISATYKARSAVGNPLPYGIYTTPLAACRYALQDALESVVWYDQRLRTMTNKFERKIHRDERDEYKREAVMLKRRLNKLKAGK